MGAMGGAEEANNDVGDAVDNKEAESKDLEASTDRGAPRVQNPSSYTMLHYKEMREMSLNVLNR